MVTNYDSHIEMKKLQIEPIIALILTLILKDPTSEKIVVSKLEYLNLNLCLILESFKQKKSKMHKF